MRVFVTGATGHIGSAVVAELLAAGHGVLGLARSERSAAALTAAGAEVQRGALDDLDVLRDGAAAADGVIHLAYMHDISLSDLNGYAVAAGADLCAIEVMGAALEGSGKPLVIASGTLGLAWVLPAGQLATERDVFDPDSDRPRVASENLTIKLAERGVRTSVVRLPPTVHSSLDHHGFVPRLIEIAREKRVSGFVGDGANRWPAVHTLDAARLFRLASETAPAGSRLHGVADEGVAFRDVAGVIARQLGIPVASIPRDEADEHFGFLGAFVSTDNPTSSTLTQQLLDWRPTHAGLIPDLEEGHYFEQDAG
jgi:nucleoside-diphosphate-sugar epimerase